MKTIFFLSYQILATKEGHLDHFQCQKTAFWNFFLMLPCRFSEVVYASFWTLKDTSTCIFSQNT